MSTMENTPSLTIPQRLAIEKQLLREEKYIVNALKLVKSERYALQREQADALCLLREVLSQGKPPGTQNESQSDQIETSTDNPEFLNLPSPPHENATSIPEDFNFTCLENVVNNDVELNLTVPSHNFYDHVPEEFDEVEAEDDYEIEMAMLMNGDKGN